MWRTEEEFIDWLLMMINEERNECEFEVDRARLVTDLKTLTLDVFDNEEHSYVKPYRSFEISVRGYNVDESKWRRMED